MTFFSSRTFTAFIDNFLVTQIPSVFLNQLSLHAFFTILKQKYKPPTRVSAHVVFLNIESKFMIYMFTS